MVWSRKKKVKKGPDHDLLYREAQFAKRLVELILSGKGYATRIGTSGIYTIGGCIYHWRV